MKVYIASDIRHARKWIEVRRDYYPEITVVSSWIDFLKDGEPNALPVVIKESWDNNLKDLLICDVVVLYVEPGDSMRGSCFESGVAFACSKPIIYIGAPETIGTLGCCFSERFTDLDHALETLAIEQRMRDSSTVGSNQTRN